MDKFSVRKAKKEDAKRIWQIRNHKISRKYSGSPEKISFKSHALWFTKKYFSGQANHCFVLSGDSVVGYCRLDLDDKNDNYIISIAIDPDFHGRGLGHKLLSEALRRFTGRKEIIAEVQKENLPSVKLFQKNNFKIFRENKKNYYLKNNNS